MRSRARSTLTAADRLHRRSEFLSIQRTGARSQTPHFVMYAAPFSETERIRLGTAVSRRLGKAVVRNRIRRRIRECFRRELRFTLPAGTAVVVIGRAGAEALGIKALTNELYDGLERLRARLPNGHE